MTQIRVTIRLHDLLDTVHTISRIQKDREPRTDRCEWSHGIKDVGGARGTRRLVIARLDRVVDSVHVGSGCTRQAQAVLIDCRLPSSVLSWSAQTPWLARYRHVAHTVIRLECAVLTQHTDALGCWCAVDSHNVPGLARLMGLARSGGRGRAGLKRSRRT